jgi:cytoskeletal protein CcmA (bactofilin family)
MLGSGKSKNKSAMAPQALLNLIGSGTIITGNIQCNGDIRVDGTVKGNMEVGQKLVIGETGSVLGDILAANVSISGTVKGNIITDETTLLHGTSSVTGDIQTRQIIIEQGGTFNGYCKMGNDLKAQKPKRSETITPESES